MLKRFLIVIIMIATTYSYSCSQQDEYFQKTSQAVEHYRNGNYQKAGESYDEAFKLGDPNKGDYYNAACSWALAGNNEKAIDYVNKAIDSGWLDIDWLKKDPDLKSLHNDQRWKAAIEKLEYKLNNIKTSFPNQHTFIKTVDLPDPRFQSDHSIEEVIKNRRSVRSYSSEQVTLGELSQILWAAYGITKKIPGGPSFLRGGLRTAPSAGALYPLEIYVVAGDVKDLEDGIYLYDSENHKLKQLQIGDKRDELTSAGLDQMMLSRAPLSLVYSAIFKRTTKKYGERGRERYVMMDVGHSAENVYLQAGAIDLGTCAVGAFSDLQLKMLINMTQEEEPL